MIFKDLETTAHIITESYPTLISEIITVIAYFTFLCVQSPIIGWVLVFISLLQIIPPLFSKRFYEKYDGFI